VIYGLLSIGNRSDLEGLTENAGHENAAQRKMQVWKMWHCIAGLEIAGKATIESQTNI